MPIPSASPDPLAAYWHTPPDELLVALHTSGAGLPAAEAAERLQRVGPNALSAAQSHATLSLLLGQLKSSLVLILVFAAAVSAFLGEWIDAGIVIAVVLGSAVLGFWQEYNAGNAVAKLRAQVTLKTTVLRGGQPQVVPADTLVPGDVVALSAGSLIPADGVLLDARDFFVNQAVLTGETFPVAKTIGSVPSAAGLAERANTVFMGTNVSSGTARALIVQTGPATAYGQIAQRLTLRAPKTSLKPASAALAYCLPKS